MKPFRERNPVVIGAVSILVIALALLAAFRAQDLPLIGGGDTYYAKFTEAGGLRVNDEVRIAGVRVGKIEEIKLDDGEVRVKFRIQDDSPFGTDTGAAIKVKTLLGSMFLAVEPAGKGQLEEGATIPTSRTSSPFDVVEAFTGLAETTSEIDTDQVAHSMTVLADLTRNTPEEFRGALQGVSRLSTNLADRDEEIGRLLISLRAHLDGPRRARRRHHRPDARLRHPVPRDRRAPRPDPRPAGLDLDALHASSPRWCARAATTSSRRSSTSTTCSRCSTRTRTTSTTASG